MLRWLLPMFITAVCVPTFVFAAGTTPVSVFSADGKIVKTISVPTTVSIGSVTAVDLGTDGVAELVTGSAAGYVPMVSVLRQNGSVIGNFNAYDARATMGINVAACDVTGDGVVDIITAPKRGGGPHIRVFDSYGKRIQSEFFAGDSSLTAGTTITCADVTGDGQTDIITATHVADSVRVNAWSAAGNALATSTFPTDANSSVSVAAGSIDSSGTAGVVVRITQKEKSIVIYTQHESGSFRETRRVEISGSAQGQSSLAIIGNVAVTTSAANGKPTARTVEGSTTYTPSSSALGSLTLGVMNEKGTPSLLAAPVSASPTAGYANKKLVVDLSEQRLTAYGDGQPVASFLISSGLRATPTPVGNFSIMAELPSHRYIGLGYDFKNVKWNLRFKRGYYIHTAYWHNNFGHPMSHGCINMREAEAKWVYDFADIGTPLEIVK